jgi:hypothetical protein
LTTIVEHVHAVHVGLIDTLDRPIDTSETVTTDSLHQQSKRETDNNEVSGIEPTLADPLQEAKIKSVIDGCKLCSLGIQNELGSMAITDIDGQMLTHSRIGACVFTGLPSAPMASLCSNTKITCQACITNEGINLGELKATKHSLTRESGCRAMDAIVTIFGYRAADLEQTTTSKMCTTPKKQPPPVKLKDAAPGFHRLPPPPLPPPAAAAIKLPPPPLPPGSSAQTSAADVAPQPKAKPRPKETAQQSTASSSRIARVEQLADTRTGSTEFFAQIRQHAQGLAREELGRNQGTVIASNEQLMVETDDAGNHRMRYALDVTEAPWNPSDHPLGRWRNQQRQRRQQHLQQLESRNVGAASAQENPWEGFSPSLDGTNLD